jgi:hypothetical protein
MTRRSLRTPERRAGLSKRLDRSWYWICSVVTVAETWADLEMSRAWRRCERNVTTDAPEGRNTVNANLDLVRRRDKTASQRASYIHKLPERSPALHTRESLEPGGVVWETSAKERWANGAKTPNSVRSFMQSRTSVCKLPIYPTTVSFGVMLAKLGHSYLHSKRLRLRDSRITDKSTADYSSRS